MVRKRKQKIPEPGDLVLVRNHAVDGQRGRKLEAKWLGPRILVLYSASKVSAHVREMYGDGKTKKYHPNDIVLYKKRSAFTREGVPILQGPHDTVPAVIEGRGAGEPGMRAVMLYNR